MIQVAHKNLMENGSQELHILTTLTQEKGVWKNPVLCGILSQEQVDPDKGKIWSYLLQFYGILKCYYDQRKFFVQYCL